MFAEVLRDAKDAAIEPAQIEVGHVGNFVAVIRRAGLDRWAGQVYPGLAMLPHLGMKPRALRRWPFWVPCEISKRGITTRHACWALSSCVTSMARRAPSI